MPRNIVRFGLLARLFQNLRLLVPLIKDYWKGNYRDVSKGIDYFAVSVLTGFKNPYVQIQFEPLSSRPPFNDETLRVEFFNKLN